MTVASELRPRPHDVRGSAMPEGAGVLATLDDPAIALRLTLVVAILVTSPAWYVRIPVVAAVVVGLVLPQALMRSEYWYSFALVLGANAVSHRWQIDNHQFLIVYWCLTLGLAAGSLQPAEVRRRSARLLIGLVFLLATVWKVLSPDFLDGSFISYTLLTDPRFEDVASRLGGIEASELSANQAALRTVHNPLAQVGPLELRSGPQILGVGKFLTWLTLLLEGTIAIAFLIPRGPLARWRDLLLITFALVTYSVAPVLGFGWILLVLGLAQRDRTDFSALYLSGFLAVLVFTSPWTTVIGL